MAVRLKIGNTTITGTVRLAGSAPIAVGYDGKKHKIMLTRGSMSLFEEAFNALLDKYSEDDRYISKINNVTPAAGGSFHILGSECDSVITDDSNEHALKITDLCPACSTCDTQYQIKRQLEFYNIYLNLIKDINLYTIGNYITRYNDLQNSYRIPTQSACSITGRTAEQEVEEFNRLLNSAGKLLHNYITTVHMWNYVVNINNNDTQLSMPPEDGCGILVQTKRALTDCSGTRSLRCTVEISPATGSVQDNLSILTPTPSTVFEPFDYTPQVSCTITNTSYTSKKATITFGPLQVAGTCIVTAKFLPFIHTVVTTGINDPATSGGVSGLTSALEYYSELTSRPQASSGGMYIFTSGSSISLPSSGGVLASSAGSLSIEVNTTTDQKLNPTREEYEQGKSYPSISADGHNYWLVQVKWEILKGTTVEQTTVDTYHFVTPKCRVPMYGVTKDSDFIEVEVEEDEETEQNV